MQRRLWRVCTFAVADLSLRPGTEMSCAGSNNDLCTVYRPVGSNYRLGGTHKFFLGAHIFFLGGGAYLCKLLGGARPPRAPPPPPIPTALVYKNSECCDEAAPATMAHLGNHQCVVSMRQKMLTVRCNKIPQ